MVMTEQESREQFENWFKDRFWHECYEDVKHHLFAAWQASRESLVIELPERMNEGWQDGDPMESHIDGEWMRSDDVIEAIEAAGLKVK